MDKNYTWFLTADLNEYAGKYVAIADERVVSSGENPGEVFEKAKFAHPESEVILWKIPKGEAFIF